MTSVNIEDHWLEELPAYALGSLEAAEAAQLEAHLEGCQYCREELQIYEAVAASLAWSVEGADPPDSTRAALLTRVARDREPAAAAEPRRRIPQLRPAWALLALAVILVGAALGIFLGPSAGPAEPTLRTVQLVGAEAAPLAAGTLIISMDGTHGTLVYDRLSPLGEGQQYQLWLIDPEDQRDSGAVFSVPEDGYGSVYVRSSRPLDEYTSFGITIEPAGGSPGPTGERALSGDA